MERVHKRHELVPTYYKAELHDFLSNKIFADAEVRLRPFKLDASFFNLNLQNSAFGEILIDLQTHKSRYYVRRLDGAQIELLNFRDITQYIGNEPLEVQEYQYIPDEELFITFAPKTSEVVIFKRVEHEDYLFEEVYFRGYLLDITELVMVLQFNSILSSKEREDKLKENIEEWKILKRF